MKVCADKEALSRQGRHRAPHAHAAPAHAGLTLPCDHPQPASKANATQHTGQQVTAAPARSGLGVLHGPGAALGGMRGHAQAAQPH